VNGFRTGVCWPEQGGHSFPIEVAFSIAGQLYALEHTGIEPFRGHVQMEAEAERHFAPITSALKNSLGTDAVFELVMPGQDFAYCDFTRRMTLTDPNPPAAFSLKATADE